LVIVRGEGKMRASLWTYNLQTGAWFRVMDSEIPVLRAAWSADSDDLLVSSRDFCSRLQR
jgi:hypothetical protein